MTSRYARGNDLAPSPSSDANRRSTANGYNAVEDYDLCTGWGSPNGKTFLAALEPRLKFERSRVAGER